MRADFPEHRCDRSRGTEAPAQEQAPRLGQQAPRHTRTGMEPFLVASVLGIGIWALLLSPFLL